MNTDVLRQRITTALSIPTLPRIIWQLNKLLDDPRAGLSDIGALIAEDAPLAARVLQIANSAYYCRQVRCHSVTHASAILGLSALRSVVTEAALITEFEHLRTGGFDLDELWTHALMTARTCARLSARSRALGFSRTDEMYICGLLHDIGQVVLVDNLEDDYLRLVETARQDRRTLCAVEEQELGTTHAEIGALVAASWGFPASVEMAIRFHHAPGTFAHAPSALVANVNALVERVIKRDPAPTAGIFDATTLAVLDLSRLAVEDAVAYLEEMLAARDTH
jgi:HD-like signal output (HDOD) protein